jgi:lipoprotein-anchoring transpeptidase ErfK/SrfK
MSAARRRSQVRPRWTRVGVAGTSVGITAIAVLGGLGGLGSLPSAADEPAADAEISSAADTSRRQPRTAVPATTISGSADSSEIRTDPRTATALPEGSGTGRRVVFSESRQRVWLVDRGHDVRRTYLVSGSVYDNLEPGTYSVYSRSEQAWGIDDSGTMRYFVRFTQGDNAAIGFHDIPVDDGEPVQTVDQLGTPQSHGCIRQRRADARALWAFAPLGTKVVVTP